MSVTTQAKELVNSDLLERLTRVGFVGYGLTHLLLARVAVQIAVQRPAEDGDQSFAAMTVRRSSTGRSNARF